MIVSFDPRKHPKECGSCGERFKAGEIIDYMTKEQLMAVDNSTPLKGGSALHPACLSELTDATMSVLEESRGSLTVGEITARLNQRPMR